MRLRDFVTANLKPVGKPVMLSQSRVFDCELGPYWKQIRSEIVDGKDDISIAEFKKLWFERYEAGELEYRHILWAEQNSYVERNIHRDDEGATFIKIKSGWAPVQSSLQMGDLACFRYLDGHPSVLNVCGLVYIYPWSEEYGKRL